jgi:glutamine synthetase type III
MKENIERLIEEKIEKLIEQVQDNCNELDCRYLIAIHNEEKNMWIEGDMDMRAVVAAIIYTLSEYSNADQILALQMITKELTNLINKQL